MSGFDQPTRSAGIPARAVVGPSRFTHLGRHQAFLKMLFSLLSEPPGNCLLLGAGPVEPFLVAELLSQVFPSSPTTVYAVDEDEQVVAFIRRLQTGKKVDLAELAHVCRDNVNQLNSPWNSNFTDRLSFSMEETVQSGSSIFRIETDQLCTVPLAPVAPDLCAIHQDALGYLATAEEPADIAYLGLLLTNLRKHQGASRCKELLTALRSQVASGLVGVGSSLSPRYGAGKDMTDAVEANFIPRLLALENVVLTEGQLSGDYGLLLETERPSRVRVKPRTSICAKADQFETHCRAVVESIAEVASIVDGVVDDELLTVSVIPTTRDRWLIDTLAISELRKHLVEGQRLWFSPLVVRQDPALANYSKDLKNTG